MTIRSTRQNRVHRLMRTIMAVIAASQLSACALIEPAIEQTNRNVATMTITVKAALIEEPSVDAASISVTAEEPSRLVLTGFVGSEAEREKALIAVGGAAPSYTIVDRLQIR